MSERRNVLRGVLSDQLDERVRWELQLLWDAMGPDFYLIAPDSSASVFELDGSIVVSFNDGNDSDFFMVGDVAYRKRRRPGGVETTCWKAGVRVDG